MTFEITLINKSKKGTIALLTDCGQDFSAFLIEICDAFEERDACEFLINGFGQDPWPVDVKTDLPIFLEQIPDVLRKIKSGVEVTLEFYEQGVERKLIFFPDGDLVQIQCLCASSWKSSPEIISMKKSDLVGMLELFASRFLQILEGKFSNISESRGLREWKSGFSAENNR